MYNSARDSILHFRPASVDDFEGCLAIDHSYQTRRVWQLSVSEQENAKKVRFQTLKLPKETAVSSPYSDEELVQRWCACDWFLVGEHKGSLQAYITAAIEKLTPTAWIYDMAVAPDHRRQGYGSQMIAAASTWASQQKAEQLMVALPMKNDPAMTFFRKSGFSFCGYNETTYRTKDISLFFSVKL